jgi:hypothetical protein
VALDIQWTRLAGQWPVEASPLVGNFDRRSGDDVLLLNRGGQVLLWSGDGSPVGSGQDGAVAQLPEGRWTTTPFEIDTSDGEPAGIRGGARFVVASVEGLVVGLNGKFQPRWQYRLPGQTLWGRALPIQAQTTNGPALIWTDQSGTMTALDPAGRRLWTNALGTGPCGAPARLLSRSSVEDHLLVPAGSVLHCLEPNGRPCWRRDLGKEIMTRPEVLVLTNRTLILCGTAPGSVFALSPDGQVLWECATGDPLGNWIVPLPRRNAAPRILFTGLWGNLHALDPGGRRVWTHFFRAKTRAMPVVLPPGPGQRAQIFVPTFNQHLYVFDEDGTRTDDIRLEGILPAAVVPIANRAPGPPDLLIGTTTLLVYRLKSGPPRSPYGFVPESGPVTLHPAPPTSEAVPNRVRVSNPDGALIGVQASLTDRQGWTQITGTLTARSAFELDPPPGTRTNPSPLHIVARDRSGRLLAQSTWPPPVGRRNTNIPRQPGPLVAWAASPFAEFDQTQGVRPAPERSIRADRSVSAVANRALPAALTEPDPDDDTVPTPDQANPVAPEDGSGPDPIAIENLYLDEADQAAFVVGSTLDEPTEVRVTLSPLVRRDGGAFAGTTLLRRVVLTPSVNGERVPDALPALDHGGAVTLAPHRSSKFWLCADAHDAQPGIYTGHVAVAALRPNGPRLALPVRIEVLSLRLPADLPLALCTWDYVPNRWFTNTADDVLDDMSRHGVNVFPRSTLPPGRVDDTGVLNLDWTGMDAELERLDQRGLILFHFNRPPLEFATPKTDAERHVFDLKYLYALRDHLAGRGRDYPDYAFYLLDEPGLDYGPNIAILIEGGRLVREADPKFLTYTDPVPGLSGTDLDRIVPYVDIWAPNMRLVAGALSGDPRARRILGFPTVWSYECVGQVRSISPLRYNRSNAWRARFFGLQGIGFWTHSTTPNDPWSLTPVGNDEYALVYPGNPPVPSARWEAARDGLEDIAALTLLEQQIQRHRDAGTQADLVQLAETLRRIALTDIMELSDEAFVESRDYLRAGDRILGHTATDIDLFQRHRAAIARLTLALAAQ